MPETTTAKKPVAAPKKVKKAASQSEDLLYPEVKTSLFHGDKPLTVAVVKDFMGWEETTAESYLLKDRYGRKIVCKKNVTNRPIYPQVYETYVQELLNKRWAGPNGAGGTINGEPLIIGKYGAVLNGQHQMVALVLADQDREIDATKDGLWSKLWPGPVVMDKLVVVGIDETDNIVNTMDTCKPRSLADVLYRSEHFAKYKEADRRMLAKACDHSIRLLWERVGQLFDAYHPRRTHAEALDFLSRHPRLLKCLQHVHEEYGDGDKRKGCLARLGLGYAAGLCYLMAASNTEGEAYRAANPPGEGTAKKPLIDFSLQDKAEEFWVLLCSGSKVLGAVNEAISYLDNPEGDDPVLGASFQHKVAVLVTAWNRFAAGDPVTKKSLKLDWQQTQHGSYVLASPPLVGGIDLGPKPEREEDDDPQAVEQAIETVRNDKEAAEGKGSSNGRAKGGVGKPEPVAYDGDGKPPAPKVRGKGKTPAAVEETVEVVEEEVVVEA